MKKVVLVLLVFTALSCSSSDSGNVIPTLPDALSIDGVTVGIQNKGLTYCYDNYFEFVVSSTNPQRTVTITFDKYGNFISANIYKFDQYSENYPYFSSHYFDFEMTPINLSEGKCVIDFSGTVYENKYDINSAPITISGHFTLQSPLPAPGGEFLYHKTLYANVDGKDWFSPNKITRSNDSGYYNCYYVCDDEYRLVFNVNGAITPTGLINFTASTIHDCIKVEKFNIATLSYEPWDTQGSFIFTERYEPFQGGYYVDGSFSLTARNPLNPAEVVHFNDGVFKALDL